MKVYEINNIQKALRLYTKTIKFCDLCWLVRFYGISTFVGYLTPNPF